MQCHVIILDTRDTTYTFYEIGKRKETKEKRKQIEGEKERRKNVGNKLSCPPPQGMWQTLEKNELEKKKKKKKHRYLYTE